MAGMSDGKCYRYNDGVTTTLSRYFGKNSKKKLASPIFYLGVLLIPVNYGCMPLMVVVKWEILGIAIITIGRITLFNIISQYLVH